MRIANRTTLDTRALKWVAQQVFERHFSQVKPDFKRRWRHFRITVEAAPNRGTRSGRSWAIGTCASLYGDTVLLRLKPMVDAAELAGVMHHEFFHCFHHAHHDQFPEVVLKAHWHDWKGRYQWAVERYGSTMPHRPRKARQQRDLVAERGAKAEQHLVAWERRLKTAQSKVKEYRKAVRYYRRRLAERQAGGPVGEDPAPGQRSLLAAPEQTQARPGIWAGSPGLAALLEGRPGATGGLDVAPGEPTAGTGPGTEESA